MKRWHWIALGVAAALLLAGVPWLAEGIYLGSRFEKTVVFSDTGPRHIDSRKCRYVSAEKGLHEVTIFSRESGGAEIWDNCPVRGFWMWYARKLGLSAAD